MDDRLAGLMHEGYFEEKFAEFKHLMVGDIMTKEVDTLRPHDAVIEAVGMFYRKGHKTIPVIENGLYIGSITRRSVLRKVTSDAC
jgi:predicted transcriptional regulator